MRELGLALFILSCLSGMGSLMASLYYSFRAAKLRQPHIPYWRAMGLQSVVLEDYLYTEEAWPLRKRAIQGMLASFFFCLMAFIVGFFSDAVHK